MAHEQRPQGQQQQQRAAATPDTEDFLSCLYTKDNAPADISPTARALLNRGYRCAADNPRLERGEWWTPDASDVETMREEPLKGIVWEPNQDKMTQDGAPSEPVEKPLMMQDGSPFGRLTVSIKRTIIRPPSRPLTFQEACQRERNKELQARREQAKAQKQKLVTVA